MKKILIAIAVLVGTSSAFAQVLSSTPFTSGNLLVTKFDLTNTTAAQKINFVEINKSTGAVVQNFNLPSTNTSYLLNFVIEPFNLQSPLYLISFRFFCKYAIKTLKNFIDGYPIFGAGSENRTRKLTLAKL
mgnify:CR=1 FL=1